MTAKPFASMTNFKEGGIMIENPKKMIS